MHYQVTIAQDSDGMFVAHCSSLPGCVGKGSTSADAVASIKDAIAEYLKSHIQNQQMYSNSTLSCQVCGNPAIVHIHVAYERKWVEIHTFCEQDAADMLRRHLSRDPHSTNVQRQLDSASRADIDLLIVKKDQWDAVYYLRELGSARRFSSTMGYCEAVALYWNLQSSTYSRHGTYPVFSTTITALSGSLQDVLITDYSEAEKAFRARLRLQQGDQFVTVDARPSDAINLAVVSDAPILVSESAWQTYERIRQP